MQRRALATVALASVVVAGCGGSGGAGRVKPKASVPSTPVALGRQLYNADSCSSCHTLDGTRATGPTWKGLYDSRVKLTSGRTVIADAKYLTEHIVDPNALTVSGYPGSVMNQAIAFFDLSSKPRDVAALVAFIRTQAR